MFLFKCHECDKKITKDYMVILGDILCLDCAEEFLDDELQELKRNDSGDWLEKISEVLGYQILEV